MKLTTHETETTFKPVTLTITFETKEELFSLWNRMYLNTSSVESVLGCNTKTVSDDIDGAVSVQLFVWLEDEIRKLDK